MTKGENLVGHFMHKFHEESADTKFQLFAEIVLGIQQMSDEEFDKVTEDKK